MPPSFTKNTNTEALEEANAVKPKKADLSMTTRAIQSFVEKKLSGWGDVFDQMMSSKCAGLETEFATFIAQNREFDGQSKEQQESFQAVTSAQFLRETISIGAGFTSKRKALDHVVSRGYDFSGSGWSKADRDKIEDTCMKLSREELTALIQSEIRRKRFLQNLFPTKTLPYREEKAQMIEIFGKNNLNPTQEDMVVDLLTKRHVTATEVQQALAVFSDEDQQKLLIKTFLPTITLGQLESMGVLTKAQVKSAVYESIERGNLVPQFSSMSAQEKKDAVDQIDPYDIVIETMLFPREVVETILFGQGSKMIAQELSAQNSARMDEAIADNALKMKPTPEGLFFPPFLAELDKLGIKNTADFKEGSIIRWSTLEKDGTTSQYAVRIDSIADEPSFNKNTLWNGVVFAMTDILLADGTLNLGVKKTMGASTPYSDMYDIFKQSKSNIEIISSESVKHKIEVGELKETVLPNEIHDLSDLNRALGSIDPKGSAYGLRADGGASIAVGEPGSPDYFVYQVKSVNESKGTIELHNGQGSEILSYVEFYSAVEHHKGKRLPPMKTAADFLSAMKAHAIKNDAYGKLSVDGDKIVSEDQKWDKKSPGVTEFAGSKRYIKILNTKTPGSVEFLVYKDFDESKGAHEQKNKPEKYTGGYNLLFAFLNQEPFKPKITATKTEVPHQEHPHIHHSKGYLKHYMGNPSFHDILHGGKGVIDAIKHKLEHGSHLHAANVQLAMGKGLRSLGLIDDGILREMRAGVHTKNKKLMQEMVDELKGMPGKERFAEVDHILGNHGSHDYEIQAATIAMLQKHWGLYIGDLKYLEGSFIFFERISGLKFSENLESVRKYRDRCDQTGEPFTEEGLIIGHMKTAGANLQVDGNLWLEIAKAWGGGIKEETEKGKDEVAKYQMSKGRIKHVMEKLEGGENAHAIGGIDGIWWKWWPAHEMHLPAIVLALSDVPSTLHQDQLNALKNKFFGGHPYTALLFLGSKWNQNTFRSVIKKLCEGDSKMASAYAEIEKLQHHDHDKDLIKAIQEFWGKYGEVLNKKLNVTEDGELIHLAKTNSDCATYLETAKWSIANINKLDADELGNEVYEIGGSSFLGLNPDHYFKFIRMNAGQATFEKDENTERLWPSFKKGLGAIRDMKAETPEIKKEIQKDLYMKYHKALWKYFSDDRLSKKVYEEDLPKQDYMKELTHKYGIRHVPGGKEQLDTPSYRQAAEEDFEAFLAGGRSIDTVKNTTTKSYKHALDNIDRGPAANDAQVKQAA